MTNDDADKIRKLHGELHAHLPEEPELRVKALETVLLKKGMISQASIDAWTNAYANHIGPKRGAELVARAWVDEAFKERLLNEPDTVICEAGYQGLESGHVRIVENFPDVHNVVVCTLCSCYPWSLLGIPPNWYKSAAYRARIVRDPRSVLAEFGLILSEDVDLRVWDSTSELRYLVLPEKPAGLSEFDQSKLADLVTRNAMIGTEKVKALSSEAGAERE